LRKKNRNTGNIEYTSHLRKTNRNTCNIEYTSHWRDEQHGS
jgi:hypothetical protein